MTAAHPPEPPPSGAAAVANNLGATTGPCVQAGTILGDVHLYGQPVAPWPVPRQIPPTTEFVNRRRELAHLNAVLDAPGTGTPVIVLSGEPGIGTSSLARYFLHTRADRFPRGLLYADLAPIHGCGTDPVAKAAAFTRALGVAATAIPTNPAEVIGLYRTMTAAGGIAVLLDHAPDPRCLTPLIPVGPGSVVLVTTRTITPQWFATCTGHVGLPPLDLEASQALYIAVSCRAGSPAPTTPSAADLHALTSCRGNPLALILSAARAHLGATPTTAVTSPAVTGENRARQGLPVAETLHQSVTSLPALAHADYATLGLASPVPLHTGLVAALLCCPADEVAGRLEPLLTAMLLAEHPAGADSPAYAFTSPQVHADAAERAGAELEETRIAEATTAEVTWFAAAARRSCATLYRASELPPWPDGPAPEPVLPALLLGPRCALEWLHEHREILLAVLRQAQAAGMWSTVWVMSRALRSFGLRLKDGSAGVEISEAELRAARELHEPAGEISALVRLGYSLQRHGQHTEAIECAAAAETLAQERGDVPKLVSAIRLLARIDRDSGDLARARQRLVQAQQMPHLVNGEDGWTLALVLLDLAEIDLATEQFGDAAVRAGRARDLMLAARPLDLHNRGRAELTRGRACQLLGQPEQARAYLAAAVIALQAAGPSRELTMAYWWLANLALEAGDVQAAHSHLVHALHVCERSVPAETDPIRATLADLQASYATGSTGGAPSTPDASP
ncbi:MULTISPECIES: ATP-binding protein [unclassified Crossiella]|uniref:ATP-binding protein n=1 Tax=unclassified Crossiella TaxID=2620835 RepID=UPI001FFF015F|nr:MULTISPECIES: ATP-binding protein [unclassified Crossiella]MCK2240956.1 ATP-binding protein [Crossiella sp. S99.2]MCK2253900.1 ATP-binding protein [Crossiella sp. S99.1]